MHANTPHAGQPSEEPSPAQRQALRQEVADVTARARALLSDEFVVGSEIVDDSDGPRATVAVQPPAGSVVTTGFSHDEVDPADLATELAAGAALEARRATTDVDRVAR